MRLLTLLVARGVAALLLPNIGEKVVTHATTASAARAWLDEHLSLIHISEPTRPY